MLRIVFLTLEFSAATFSGNGIYAQSQVRALSKSGHRVFVISGKPNDHAFEVECQGACQLVEVPVSVWGQLGASAPYQEYAAGGSTLEVATAVAAFQPDVVLTVDWSALQLYRSLNQQLQGALPPMVYLNYRVFSRSATGEQHRLVSRMEREAVEEAILTVALSRSDVTYLSEHMDPQVGPGEGQQQLCDTAPALPPSIRVLLPALREDMRLLPLSLGHDEGASRASGPMTSEGDGAALLLEPACSVAGTMSGQSERSSQQKLHIQVFNTNNHGNAADLQHHDDASAQAAADFIQARPYLTCCVRLSPEKEPQRFVELVEELAQRGALGAITPLMVGSSNDEYAEGLKCRLRAAAPGSVVLEQFMGSEGLAEVYSRTRLNIHPATYDAYGMTIVEAASQGAPSLVHDGQGAVGATDLLSAAAGEVLLAPFTAGAQELASRVQQLLAEPALLQRVGLQAAAKARSWSEEANAAALVAMVKAALDQHANKKYNSVAA